MKRYYRRPTFTYETFQANEAISACKETATYNPVRVDCVITKHHHIFYTGCENITNCDDSSDCDGGINYNNAVIVKYNGGEYLVWGQGITAKAGGGSNVDTSTLNAIISAGIDQDIFPEGTSAKGKHAGLITPDIEIGINHS